MEIVIYKNPPLLLLPLIYLLFPPLFYLQIKHLFQDPNSIVRILDRMPRSPLVLIDLVIVTTLEGLVSKEMDGLVVDPGEVLGWIGFVLDMLQAVGLVPAVGEDVEGDLAADRIAALDDIVSLVLTSKPWLGGRLGEGVCWVVCFKQEERILTSIQYQETPF